MSIFRAYDIRGIYPKELNINTAYKIGRAVADFFKVKSIAVGRDMRVHGEVLSNAFVKGVMDQGTDVIDIGLISTPMLYFASAFLKTKANIMVTASHNPKEYNGFKLARQNAIPVSGETGIKEIEKLYNRGRFRKARRKGKLLWKVIDSEYAKHVLKFSKSKDAKFKIVIDAANGMAGKEVPLVFGKLKHTIIPMYFELDGTFPNHDANPLKGETLEQLKRMVLKENADLGIAFDGDADRVFFITDEGEALPSDFITALIAKSFLKNHKKAKILYDVRSSWIVKETVKASKGTPKMCRVGHAFIKAEMRKEKALFGGELSGHFYFKDNWNADSGIIAVLKILDLMAETKQKLSELVKPLRKYHATGEINFEVKDKEAKMKELARKYKNGRISWLDGIRVDFNDWWFNARPSNTEPLLRLNLEAKTKELMKKKKEEIVKVIRS